MTLEVDLWQLVGFFLGFLGFVFTAARLLLNQIEKHQNERFARLEGMLRKTAENQQHLEKEVNTLKVNLPLDYVRRDDYIRGQTVIEAKLDALYDKLDRAQRRQSPRG